MKTGRKPNGYFTKGNKLSSGRPVGAMTVLKREIKDNARNFLERTEYWENLEQRIFAGEAPHLETLLFYYAYGKPLERLALTNPDGTREFSAGLYDFRTRIAKLLGGPPPEAPAVESTNSPILEGELVDEVNPEREAT